MAKKSRRVRKRGREVRLSPTQMTQPATREAADVARVTSPARSASQVPDLRDEYRYVVADLRRIGVIAVAMLAALIVLAFLLA